MKKRGQRLADVCKQLDLQPYVLRYWLTEFPALGGAEKGSSANRVFAADEVALLGRIKTLLYDEGYTIAGAKKKLDSEPPPSTRGGKRGAATPLFEEGETDAADDDAGADAERSTEPASLDTLDDERIENLRQGIADALAEARAILDRLQARR